MPADKLSIPDVAALHRIARATAMGGAVTPEQVGKVGAKAGVTAGRALRLAVDAGWPSEAALRARVQELSTTLNATPNVTQLAELVEHLVDHADWRVAAAARMAVADLHSLVDAEREFRATNSKKAAA